MRGGLLSIFAPRTPSIKQSRRFGVNISFAYGNSRVTIPPRGAHNKKRAGR